MSRKKVAALEAAEIDGLTSEPILVRGSNGGDTRGALLRVDRSLFQIIKQAALRHLAHGRKFRADGGLRLGEGGDGFCRIGSRDRIFGGREFHLL